MMTWTNGVRFDGNFVNGKRNGDGTLYFPDGDFFMGMT